VQTGLFTPARFSEAWQESGPPTIINPRGFRAYVRNDVFFQAIPLVLARRPEAHFVCPAMAGEPAAHHWLRALQIEHAVDLLPKVSRPAMAELFQTAQITVSPTHHDGTPNTLLEAMACGSFPIAGDIESLREWITPGENGLLVDPADPQALATAILAALDDPALRQKAAARNREMITGRAAHSTVMEQAEKFYEALIARASK